MATLILFLPLITAAVIHFLPRGAKPLAPMISVGSVIATLIMSVLLWAQSINRTEAGQIIELGSWVNLGSLLQLKIDFKLNQLATGMMLVVTSIGTLVQVFSLGYMKDDEAKARYFAGLSLFMFSMTGIVLANNLAMMFIFWELVGISSYLLIGHWFQKNSAADAAKKAFLTNRIGDFGFMIGILLLWKATGHLSFDGIAANLAGNEAILTVATLCLFCGAMGKSAQLPLHVWLPDAMEGPTPVSALIHAATMVAAGVYMMVRMSFLLVVPEAALAADTIAWIGGITAVFAALCATQQNDIKKVLAYSTLSQLGYMIMAVGLLAKEAAMFHLFTHAFFKALLFLGSGAIIYACHHEQNIWKMGGLAKKMPQTMLTFAIGTAALIAVPWITSGFWSKEEILFAAYGKNKLLFFIAVFTAFLTAFYMTRLFVVVFLGSPRDHGAEHAHEVSATMKMPLLILAVPAVIAGFPFIGKMFLALPTAPHTSHVPLIASLITLVAGVGLGYSLYRGRNEEPRPLSLLANKFYLDELYAKLIRWGQDAVASFVAMLDFALIEGLGMRGTAGLASVAGAAFRRLQSGNLQSYAFFFGLGVLIIVMLALSEF